MKAAMLSTLIAAFCIIDDALKVMGHKGDPQAKVPTSAILTLAILGRRVVEKVGSMLHHLFPRRIHAVTPEGFALK